MHRIKSIYGSVFTGILTIEIEGIYTIKTSIFGEINLMEWEVEKIEEV